MGNTHTSMAVGTHPTTAASTAIVPVRPSAASSTVSAAAFRGSHGHTEPTTTKQEEEFLQNAMRVSLQEHRTPRDNQIQSADRPTNAAPPKAGIRLQYSSVQSAFADPNVQRILATRSDMKGVDRKYWESVDMIRKISFAQALGGSIGNTVSLNAEEAQPEWAPLIKQAGLLFRKVNNGSWTPGVFFVFNGFFVGCEVHPAGTQRVELATLDLGVSLSGYGVDPRPLPLQNCRIFAADGVREFQIQIEIPGGGGKRKALDLAAESVEVREQWIEEIFKGANVGDGYGSRGEYVPKSFRNKSAAQLKEASQAQKHGADVWNKAQNAANKVALAGRSCADDAGPLLCESPGSNTREVTQS